MKTLKEIRNALYGVNATNVGLYMIGLKKRDDKIVYDTNKCLAEILSWLDEHIDAEKARTPKNHVLVDHTDKIVFDTGVTPAIGLAQSCGRRYRTTPETATPGQDPDDGLNDDRLGQINGQIVSILEGYDAPEDREDVAEFLRERTGLSIETVARILRAITRR